MISLTAADVLNLSREQLAGYVLEELNARAKGHNNGPESIKENQSNYLSGIEAEYGDRDVTDAFSSARRWMIDQGHVADVPGQMAHGWYRLTAKGRLITTHDKLQTPRVPRDVNPGPAPNFSPLTTEGGLRKHLHVLWEEAVMCYQGDAHLSTVIMLGSLLEGMLLAKAQSNPAVANRAKAAPKRDGVVKPFDEWYLNDFIQVARECNWIHGTRLDLASNMREYRNLVHPFKAASVQYRADKGTATICWQVVMEALRDLGVAT